MFLPCPLLPRRGFARLYASTCAPAARPRNRRTWATFQPAVTGKATAAASDADQREPYSSARGRALATIEVAMLYTPANARGAQVIDMDTLKPMDRVLEVNTRAGWVKVVPDPSRIDALGQLLGERIRFRSIYPIFGGATMPCLFHCYGRQG